MRKMQKSIPVLAVALLALVLLSVTAVPAQEDAEARKARILANITVQFPQIAQAEITMGEITPTEFEGLDQGSFSVGGRGTQQFLVSRDNKKLWMVGAQPIDVSRSEEEIQVELAKIEEAKAKEAADRQQKLDDAIAGYPVRGNPDAPVTIVEFSDFQCPYCTRGAQTVEALLEKYPNDVKFVFKHFPLGFHNWAKPAAIASLCAGEQNDEAFWTLHDSYFASQKSLTKDNVLDKSKEFLADAGIDMAKWSTCAEDTTSAEYQAASAAVDADMAFGQSPGVSGTPGFFVNGEFLNGAQPVEKFAPLIEKAKAGT